MPQGIVIWVLLTSHDKPFSTVVVNVLSPLHVRETSPGTHTFFHTYTCPVYCWRSVQLLDFSLSCGLIHASQPVRTTFTGQCFASGFLQTPPRGDALAFGCILPTAGRIRNFHPLERAPAGHTCIRACLKIFSDTLYRYSKSTYHLPELRLIPPPSLLSLVP